MTQPIVVDRGLIFGQRLNIFKFSFGFVDEKLTETAKKVFFQEES